MREDYSPWWKKYKAWVQENPEEASQAYEQVLKQVAVSPAKYKGNPVEFLYQPFFLTNTQWKELEQINHYMMKIMEKVIQHYVQHTAFREHFQFPPLMEQLILKEPGYQQPVPVTRVDLFYHLDTGDFQFCEINTDGSSGMVEARELQQIIGDSEGVKALEIEEQDMEQGEYLDSWVDALMENYRQWCQFHHRHQKRHPQIAIVDLFSSEPPSEFIEFKKAFEKNGYPCVVVDARDLSLRNGRLSTEGKEIDVVYRRLVTWEMVENKDTIEPLIEAILTDAVCLVGPVRSQIPHNKRFFAVLHDEKATNFLNAREREFVRRHVPYTAKLSNTDDEQWQDWIKNKDHLIIKPDDRYASFGVFAGRDYAAHEWEEKLETAVSQSYLIQQYCSVPRVDMAVFSDQEPVFQPFYYLIGCFLYNGVFQGPYIRVGSHSIIGSVVECFTVPAFCVT